MKVTLPLAALMRVKGAVVDAPVMSLDTSTGAGSDPLWQVNTVVNTAGNTRHTHPRYRLRQPQITYSCPLYTV